MDCSLHTYAKLATEALDHVIQRTKNDTENRRSIIVLPMVGRNSPDFNSIVKRVVDNNIVVVTAAGKPKHLHYQITLCEPVYIICVHNNE